MSARLSEMIHCIERPGASSKERAIVVQLDHLHSGDFGDLHHGVFPYDDAE